MNIPSIGDTVPKRGNKISRAIAKGLLQLYGWRITGEVPNKGKFIVIGAPHTSSWDFPLAMVAMYALGVKIYWLGKDSLFRAPYGGIMRWLGGIAINRSSPHNVVDQMVAEFNHQDKLIICILPEGTRKKVTNWKTGFYHIAHGANLPILLAALDYQHKVVNFGATVTPSGDLTADMERIQSFYTNIAGKNHQ